MLIFNVSTRTQDNNNKNCPDGLIKIRRELLRITKQKIALVPRVKQL